MGRCFQTKVSQRSSLFVGTVNQAFSKYFEQNLFLENIYHGYNFRNELSSISTTLSADQDEVVL